MKYYLAIDIGASSGRMILGAVTNGMIITEEIHRFENHLVEQEGHFCWDYDRLFREICSGMAKCKEQGKAPLTMAIDTWGVDFVLLDCDNNVIGPTVAYRDSRTEGMDRLVSELCSPRELYARTGIQKAIFNTIYQLMAIKKQNPGYLEQADCFLMTPGYFDFLLTGKRMCEYTVASTTQLLCPETKTWDFDLLEQLNITPDIFPEITMPGTKVGRLRKEIVDVVGFDCDVIQACAHDTASAVMAVPVYGNEKAVFLSSGTWSLMGVERMVPDLSEKSRACNFTNEGGYEHRYRYLKNIMGLWMIQSVKKELDNKYSFVELCKLAEAAECYPGRFDVNESRFLAPKSMIEEVKKALSEAGYSCPDSVGELVHSIYQSLADCYSKTVRELEELTGETYECIHIIGGGCNAEYLNRLTEQATGKKVVCGPSEATAVGNLICQMINEKEFADLDEARKVIAVSFLHNDTVQGKEET